MRFTIHRGTHEIGGSCVSVETARTRLVVDAGMPLVDANREPFDSKSAVGKSVDELIRSGTIPQVPGVFTTDIHAPDAILLSHAHLDHSGLLHLSRPDIPIYTAVGTSKMMLSAAVFGGQNELARSRHRPVRPGEVFHVGDFTVTPFAVDHSTFGSLAFLIEAEGKSLLYTGDIRLHGRKPGMARDLIRQVAPKHIDVLLTEGTHFGTGTVSGVTEHELEEQIVHHVESARGLVLAAFSPLDVDRLVTFYRAAQRTGRTFVVDAYAGLVMHLIAGEARIPRPVTGKGIRVYFNRSFERRQLANLKELFEPDRITLAEVLDRPGQHVMVFRPSMTALDFGGQFPTGGRVVYSYWLGYLKNADWIELQQKVSAAGGDFIPAHASGHIYIADILTFVRSISPRLVVPMHTFEPQRFREHFPNTHLLQDGETFLVP